MPNFSVTQPHLEEAKLFQKGLRSVSIEPGLKTDEEIAIFYETGKETIRVTHLKMASDSILLLTGKDEWKWNRCRGSLQVNAPDL